MVTQSTSTFRETKLVLRVEYGEDEAIATKLKWTKKWDCLWNGEILPTLGEISMEGNERFGRR